RIEFGHPEDNTTLFGRVIYIILKDLNDTELLVEEEETSEQFDLRPTNVRRLMPNVII
ncbi:hypothetical protein IWQ60_003691, partial [Tieghemiomyces parasiticus]